MPARYYSKEFTFGGTIEVKVLIVFVDTNILSPLSLPQTSPGGIYAVSAEETQAHLNFIENALSTSTAQWKLIAGHHTSIHSIIFTKS